MVRYTNHTNHQPGLRYLKLVKKERKPMTETSEGLSIDAALVGVAVVDCVSPQQFVDAIYKKLAAERFFTRHTVERITVKQFLAMLAVARIEQYKAA